MRGFTKSKKKHMLKISAVHLIGNPEIPIHYTSLGQVEQALLHCINLVEILPESWILPWSDISISLVLFTLYINPLKPSFVVQCHWIHWDRRYMSQGSVQGAKCSDHHKGATILKVIVSNVFFFLSHNVYSLINMFEFCRQNLVQLVVILSPKFKGSSH